MKKRRIWACVVLLIVALIAHGLLDMDVIRGLDIVETERNEIIAVAVAWMGGGVFMIMWFDIDEN